MKNRLDYKRITPDAISALSELDNVVNKSGLERGLVELVKVRVSQINGCAYCIDMHSKNARAGGESEQRLYELNAWRETDFYTGRERAALGWTEAVTMVDNGHVPDEVYEEARRWFSDTELVALTVAVIAINGWNRFSIAFRRQAGTYNVEESRAA